MLRPKLRRDLLSRNLSLIQGRRSGAEMAAIIGAKSHATYDARKRDPMSLTLREVYALCDDMDIPAEKFLTKELL